MLNRKLAFNYELYGEAEKIYIKSPCIAKQLIASIKIDVCDAISGHCPCPSGQALHAGCRFQGSPRRVTDAAPVIDDL